MVVSVVTLRKSFHRNLGIVSIVIVGLTGIRANSVIQVVYSRFDNFFFFFRVVHAPLPSTHSQQFVDSHLTVGLTPPTV